MRRAPLLPALVVALIVACDGGAPVQPTPPPPAVRCIPATGHTGHPCASVYPSAYVVP
jgi:hypothetical protein